MHVASGKRLRNKTNNDNINTKLIILFCHYGVVRGKTSVAIMKSINF